MNRLIRTTCAIAAEDIGQERARRIAEKAQRRYEALCAENASDSKALRAHTFRRIYPGIAVYEALRAEGVEPEKAVWYIREYFQRFFRKGGPASAAGDQNHRPGKEDSRMAHEDLGAQLWNGRGFCL